MRLYEKLLGLSIEEFAQEIESWSDCEVEPWHDWFESEYCEHCAPVYAQYPLDHVTHACAYCELNDKCRHFPEMNHIPTGAEIVEMWLEQEVK